MPRPRFPQVESVWGRKVGGFPSARGSGQGLTNSSGCPRLNTEEAVREDGGREPCCGPTAGQWLGQGVRAVSCCCTSRGAALEPMGAAPFKMGGAQSLTPC